MNIDINELLEAMKGYGSDDRPITIGILKAILEDIKNNKIKA